MTNIAVCFWRTSQCLFEAGSAMKLICRAASSITNKSPMHYRVVIAGGGTGGCAVAARLRSHVPSDQIAIIEPSKDHFYQSAFTLVGAGMMDLSQTSIPTEKAISNHGIWINDSLAELKPTDNRAILSSGQQITYDYLVISLGLTLRYDMLKGALDALKVDPRVCSNYSPAYVNKTYAAMKQFRTGTALFMFPNTPIKCAGAPLKVMYLFEDYLKKRKRKGDAQIMYFTPSKAIFSVDKYAKRLLEICKQRDIETRMEHNLLEIDHKKSLVMIENLTNKEIISIHYDLLHVVPPMTTPPVLSATPDLTDTNATHFVTVDASTMQHDKFSNIFALGDCSNLPTSKTAASISCQCKILTTNLVDLMKGGSGKIEKYDGYTSCPLITGYNKGILAEFDYTLKPLETLPFDQGRESFLYALIKKKILPALYWNGILKGIWAGPRILRKILHLGFSK